ncbi:MAG: type II toxin-antitoxin system HipA family toxin [Methylotenera sp.]|nr:type II toxin-antitoxin system HipA family toxin [Methylotenera sp.]
MPQTLNVWMNGILVGQWSQDSRGSNTFQYDPAWINSEYARPLSNSIPIIPSHPIVKGEVVAHYFDNLLPDSAEIRNRIQSKFRTGSTATIELLQAIGRDCVGAVQILPISETPIDVQQISSSSLNDRQIAERLIANSAGRVLGQEIDEDYFWISIAGAQEKTALLKINGEWHLPHGSTPTTHILKLPLGLIGGERRFDMTTSIENEWLCAKILEKLDFNVAQTEIATFEGTKALVVKRFDRKWVDNNTWIARIPQEDFCQVFGLPNTKKYEADGGPGIVKIMQYLTASQFTEEDRLHFIKTQFMFWLLAASDGHAKNFSVTINEGGQFQLTPLYDVLSAWPIIGNQPNQIPYQKAKLAMAIRSKNAHYNFDDVARRHWQEFTRKLGVPNAFAEMQHIADKIIEKIDSIYEELPERFPVGLIDNIKSGVEKHVSRFNTVE